MDSSDIATIVVALIAVPGAIFASVVALMNNKRASAIENRKVDQEAYDRAVKFYREQLEFFDAQLDKMRTQIESMSGELADERVTSATLRAKVATLEGQLAMLKQTLATMRAGVAPGEFEGPFGAADPS